MKVSRVWIGAAALFLFSGVPPAGAQATADVEDRLEIAEQLAQYAYRWDGKDAEGFADLFTEDGVMDRRRAGNPIQGARVVGRAAILAYANTSHTGRLADRQTRHHFSGVVFLELSRTHAVTEHMALITHQPFGQAAAHISGSGIYRNTWRKTAVGWRIAERILFSDGVSSR